MNEFVLVILEIMGLSKVPSAYEIRVPTKIYKNVLKFLKRINFNLKSYIPHKGISVKTRCEKVIGKQRQLENEKSI